MYALGAPLLCCRRLRVPCPASSLRTAGAGSGCLLVSSRGRIALTTQTGRRQFSLHCPLTAALNPCARVCPLFCCRRPGMLVPGEGPGPGGLWQQQGGTCTSLWQVNRLSQEPCGVRAATGWWHGAGTHAIDSLAVQIVRLSLAPTAFNLKAEKNYHFLWQAPGPELVAEGARRTATLQLGLLRRHSGLAVRIPGLKSEPCWTTGGTGS